MRCREASRLSSEAMDRRLSFADRASLRIHLAICNGCTNFQRQVAFLRDAIARLGSRDP